MRLRLSQPAYRLRSGELISLVNAAGYEVACYQGVAWVTIAGDARDIWLHAGQRLVLPGNAKIVVEGGQVGGEAHLSLHKPVNQSYQWLRKLQRRAVNRVSILFSGLSAAASS